MRIPRAILPVLLALLATAPVSAQEKGIKKMELVSRLGRKASVKIYSGETLTFRVREKPRGLDGLAGGGDYLRGIAFELRYDPKVVQDAVAMVKGANRGVVREQKPEPDLWGLPPSKFEIGDEKPGRYVLTATKKGYAPARIVVHLAAFEIVDIDGELTDRHYAASFAIRLIDPDEEGKPIPILVESLDEDGRVIDKRHDVAFVRVKTATGEFTTSRRVQLASNETESFEARWDRRKDEPVPPDFFDRKAMRIVEGGRIRISFRNLHAVYDLPLGY
jgi:hypothetical protein